MKKFKKSLKSKITYFVLFLMSIGFMQCSLLFEDTNIWPERPPYFQTGDTLIYKSDSNEQYFYVESAKLYAVGEYGDSESEKNWDFEKYASSMTQFNCVDSCCSFGSVITPSEYWVAYKKGTNHASYRILNYEKNYSLQIGKYNVKQLYRSYNIEVDSIIGKEICSLLHSKKYGVVEYELCNGEVFTLLEACITKMKNNH